MIKSDKVMKSGYGPSCANVPVTRSRPLATRPRQPVPASPSPANALASQPVPASSTLTSPLLGCPAAQPPAASRFRRSPLAAAGT